MTGALLDMNITGTGGLSLRDKVGGGIKDLPRSANCRLSNLSQSPAQAVPRCSSMWSRQPSNMLNGSPSA